MTSIGRALALMAAAIVGDLSAFDLEDLRPTGASPAEKAERKRARKAAKRARDADRAAAGRRRPAPFTGVACSLCGCDRLADCLGFPTVCSGLDCPDPLHDFARTERNRHT